MLRGITLIFSAALLVLAISASGNGGSASRFSAGILALMALVFFGFWFRMGKLRSMQAELYGLQINNELTAGAVMNCEWALVQQRIESAFEKIGEILGVAWINGEGPLIVRIYSYNFETRCVRFFVARNRVKKITIEARVL